MNKNFWKELAIGLGLLWLIYLALQLFAPFLLLSMWDSIRAAFGLGLILIPRQNDVAIL